MVVHRFVRLGLVAVVVLVVAGCGTWASQSVPSGTGPLTGISCPSVTDCVAVGNTAILTTDNGGSSWASHSLPTGVFPDGVSCPTTTHCVAVGGNSSLTTDDGGQTWVSGSIPVSATTDVRRVSCPSITFCVAVGGSFPSSGSIVTTTDGGATWVSSPVAAASIGDVSCASTTVCVAVGSNGQVGQLFTTTDGGVTWVTQNTSGLMQAATAISCPSISTCVASGLDLSVGTGNSDLVLKATTDGGTTWVNQTPPSPAPGSVEGIVEGISCASTTTCVGVGGPTAVTVGGVGIIATTNGGATWTNQTVPSGVTDLRAVSCPSPISCIAVGQNQQGGAAIIRTG